MIKLSFLILLLLGCGSRNLYHVKKATVTAASFSIETPFSLNCELFETNLTESKQTKDVNQEDFEELTELLLKLEPASMASIDVRGELWITFEDNKNQKLCFTQNGIFYNGTNYFKNQQLGEFLIRKNLAIP